MPPPVTDVGATVTPTRVGAMTVMTAALEIEPRVLVIVAVLVLCTAMAPTLKVALDRPAPMVTVAGTVAVELLDVSATAVPPVGAGPLKVTVPVEVEPPVTVVGERVKDTRAAGVIVRVAD